MFVEFMHVITLKLSFFYSDTLKDKLLASSIDLLLQIFQF